MNDSSSSSLPVAVIGAGPVGLAAAAHLASRGLPFVLFEAGSGPGASLETVRHVRLFSGWRYDVDPAARALLESAGWNAPDDDALPTAGELVDRYLAPLAALPAVAPHVRFRHRVTAATRRGFDKSKSAGREDAPFVLRVRGPEGEREVLARAVLDASGTWTNPNPLGGSGLDALGEDELRARIAYGMPDILGRDRGRYAGKRVLVAGAGHSAMGNLIALAVLADEAPRTRIAWVVRSANVDRVFGGGENDGFAARGELGTRLRRLVDEGRLEVHAGFRIHALRDTGEGIEVTDEPGDVSARRIRGVDAIIASTGSRPDLSLARELRLRLDPWLESTEALAPLIDPNVHSCGTVRPHGHRQLEHPDRGYYAVGAKSYGRATSFLLATGYEQVRSVVAAIAGDLAAADDVRLELPETGVCSADRDAAPATGGGCCGPKDATPEVEAPPAATGCCGGPAPSGTDACCVLDAEAKAEGKSGCGCGEPATDSAAAPSPPKAARSGCC